MDGSIDQAPAAGQAAPRSSLRPLAATTGVPAPSFWQGQARGLACIFAAATLGSVFGVFMRALGHYGAFGVLAVRCVVQSACMASAAVCIQGPAVLAVAVRGVTRTSALAMVAMAGQNLGISIGVLTTTVSNTFFVVNTAPAVCVLSDALVLKENVRLRTWLMVAFCLSGTLVIVIGTHQSGGSLGGCFIAMINPLSWAVYWGIQRVRARQGATSPGPADLVVVLLGAQAVVFLAAVVGLLLGGEGQALAGWTEAREQGQLVRDAAIMLAFAGLYMPAVQVLFTLAPRYIPTAEVACVKVTEALWAPLWIFFFQGEVPGIHTWVGGASILVAIVGHSLLSLREGSAGPKQNDAAASKDAEETHEASPPAPSARDLDAASADGKAPEGSCRATVAV